jgi:hypothetical protein
MHKIEGRPPSSPLEISYAVISVPRVGGGRERAPRSRPGPGVRPAGALYQRTPLYAFVASAARSYRGPRPNQARR